MKKLLFLLLILNTIYLYGQDRITGELFATRSEVIAQNGMVATSHPLASQIGIDILKEGGNAIDAAIAANAALGLMEPTGNGIGGDLFAIVWDAKTKKLHGLNASGPAPKNISIEYFIEKGLSKIPAYGPLPVTVPGAVEEEFGYWRDVGTLDAYWESNMDLVGIKPEFDLYNQKWPVRSHTPPLPPAKFVHFSDLRTGHAINAIISAGSIISGALVINSVLGYNVRVHSYSHISESVIMNEVDIARNCRIKRAIIDKQVKIGPDTVIGYDLEADRERYHVTDSGIVVIPKGSTIN